MKLSRKADYALRILFALIEQMGKEPVSMATLARKNHIPKRYLEHIMLDLKSKGWVESSLGRMGGYFLASPPERITLGQVIRYFDGLIAPVGCVSISQHESCGQAASCRFRRVLLEIRNLTTSHLDNATLAEVAQAQPVAKWEIFRLELLKGEGI